MEIRDVIHGAIKIEAERKVIDSRFFQRLRQIRQLGFGEYSFPSATHNRYIHSLGAMETASQAFSKIFDQNAIIEAYRKSGGTRSFSTDELCSALSVTAPAAFKRFRAVLRLAALLHDVGHGPLSHTTEFAMPPVRNLNLPVASPEADGNRQATHEDYTLKIILDSSLTPVLEEIGRMPEHGFEPLHIAALIEPSLPVKDDFFYETVGGKRIHFRPILQQLVSSELDADRMDYLRRDSRNAGVSYGQFDFDWLVSNLTPHVPENGDRCFLALQHRALYAFEDFLISRYHMFLMVYFHYKSVVFDEMLSQYFKTEKSANVYQLPSDIEAYCECHDDHLYSHLARSENEWAKRILQKEKPYRLLVEFHSGIPATKKALEEQERQLAGIEEDLGSRGMHYLTARSTGELSKYFRKPGDPIFVRYDNSYNQPSFIPLGQCTDLFERYKEKRWITRIYVSPENWRKLKSEGRYSPLSYE